MTIKIRERIDTNTTKALVVIFALALVMLILQASLTTRLQEGANNQFPLTNELLDGWRSALREGDE